MKRTDEEKTVSLLIECAGCEKTHDGDVEGGWCLVCKQEFCGDCSQWQEKTQQRECRGCENAEAMFDIMDELLAELKG